MINNMLWPGRLKKLYLNVLLSLLVPYNFVIILIKPSFCVFQVDDLIPPKTLISIYLFNKFASLKLLVNEQIDYLLVNIDFKIVLIRNYKLITTYSLFPRR